MNENAENTNSLSDTDIDVNTLNENDIIVGIVHKKIKTEDGQPGESISVGLVEGPDSADNTRELIASVSLGLASLFKTYSESNDDVDLLIDASYATIRGILSEDGITLQPKSFGVYTTKGDSEES